MVDFEIKGNEYFINSKKVPENVFNLMVQEQNERNDKKRNWTDETKFFDKLPLKFNKKVPKEKYDSDVMEMDCESEHELKCECDICKIVERFWDICNNTEYEDARDEMIEIMEIYGQNQHDVGVANTFQSLGTEYLKNAGIIEHELKNNTIEFEDKEIE